MSKYFDNVTKEIYPEIKEELNQMLDPLMDLNFIKRGKTELVQKYLKNQQYSLQQALNSLDEYVKIWNFDTADYYLDIVKNTASKINEYLENELFCYKEPIITSLSWEDVFIQENQPKSVIADISEIRDTDSQFIKANAEYLADKELTEKEIGGLLHVSDNMQPEKIIEFRNLSLSEMDPEIRKSSEKMTDVFTEELQAEIVALKDTVDKLNQQIYTQNELIQNLEKNYMKQSTLSLSAALDKASSSLQKAKNSIIKTGKETSVATYAVLKDAYLEAEKTFSTARSICAQTAEKANRTFISVMNTITFGAYAYTIKKLLDGKDDFVEKHPSVKKLLETVQELDPDYYEVLYSETWDGQSPIQSLEEAGYDIENLDEKGIVAFHSFVNEKLDQAIQYTKDHCSKASHYIQNNISNACSMLKANVYGIASRIVEEYGEHAVEIKGECARKARDLHDQIQTLQEENSAIQSKINDLKNSKIELKPSMQLQQKLNILEKFGDLDLKGIQDIKKEVKKELKEFESIKAKENKAFDKEISKLNKSSDLISSAIQANMEKFDKVTDKLVDMQNHVNKVADMEQNLIAKAIAAGRNEQDIDEMELD